MFARLRVQAAFLYLTLSRRVATLINEKPSSFCLLFQVFVRVRLCV